LVRLESELNRLKDRPEEINNLARRALALRQEFEVVLESREPEISCSGGERRGRGAFLGASPH